MNPKFKCIIYSTVLLAIITSEISNLICEHCGRLHLPEHLPERNFQNNVPKANAVVFSNSASTSTITTFINLT